MREWIDGLFRFPKLVEMGHHQRVEDANLGLGWVYYGLARTHRPRLVVVIGSYRGFVPLVLGKALEDNLEGGAIVFIDPSMVDDFWKDPESVEQWFASFGLQNVRHYLMTTQQFVETGDYRDLGAVGMLFIDGYHSLDQVRFDYEAFHPKLSPDALVLFHDSIRVRLSRIYGEDRAYEHGVKHFIDELRRAPDAQILDLPYADGVTLLRRVPAT